MGKSQIATRKLSDLFRDSYFPAVAEPLAHVHAAHHGPYIGYNNRQPTFDDDILPYPLPASPNRLLRRSKVGFLFGLTRAYPAIHRENNNIRPASFLLRFPPHITII